MEIESRLRKMEAEVHQTRMLVWVVLVLVLAIGLGLLQVAVDLGLVPLRDLLGYFGLVLVALVLIAMACLLVSAASGLRRFWTTRAADAQLQERILREVIAERAKARDPDPNP
jgi:hypothetical protein